MFAVFRSFYSMKYGVLSLDRIIEIAKQLSLKKIILADINFTGGFFELLLKAQHSGIEVIPACEFRKNNHLLFTLVAINHKGFESINKLLSTYLIHQVLPEHDDLKTNENIAVVYPSNSQFGYHALSKTDNRRNKSNDLFFPIISLSNEDDFWVHQHLVAIGTNNLLSKLKNEDLVNAKENIIQFIESKESIDKYSYAFKNHIDLESKLEFNFSFKTNKNKLVFSSSMAEDSALLKKLSYEGYKMRYGNNKEAYQRLEYELSVIEKLGFVSYFLITYDIVSYSLNKGFYHVGRGSGANSIVAYCLRITDVDPIKLNLYFERFLNPKRTSPPDFDIDYSWKERDIVLKYIFKKHGENNTALLGTFVTFRDSSILRELGKVYGLPKEEIDNLEYKNLEEGKNQDIYSKIFNIGKKIENFPSYNSIHAGGVLISNESIFNFSAVHLPPKGFQTVQWDMYTAEDIGFEKFDILSQRGIGHIKDAVTIISENKNQKVDIHEVDKFIKDEKVKDQLHSGNTIGCFYIESPAMRGLLKKLRCREYITLVAASSIIRPGVSRSGMMKQYIYNFHYPQKINYLHPIMKEQLEETFGVMVYQEDVLKVCHHFAGLDLADADVLRRGMSGKFRSKKEFDKLVEKFFQGAKELNRPLEVTKEVWHQVESFAGYSFSKAHSASFAVESFQSLFLKTYYPIEFMVAVINNFGGFYQTWVYVNEARKCGAVINLPCALNSELNTIVKNNVIYLGFNLIKGLESDSVNKILKARNRNNFNSLQDFFLRTNLSKEQNIILIKTGVLHKLHQNKKELLWKFHETNHSDLKTNNLSIELFNTQKKEFQYPALHHETIEDAFDEIEYIGFPVSLNYFNLLKTKQRTNVFAENLNQYINKTIRIMGTLVTTKPVKTIKNELMYFGTFLDENGNFFDTVHFPPSLKEYGFKGSGVYLIMGKVTEEFEFCSIEVTKMAKLPFLADPRY